MPAQVVQELTSNPRLFLVSQVLSEEAPKKQCKAKVERRKGKVAKVEQSKANQIEAAAKYFATLGLFVRAMFSAMEEAKV